MTTYRERHEGVIHMIDLPADLEQPYPYVAGWKRTIAGDKPIVKFAYAGESLVYKIVGGHVAFDVMPTERAHAKYEPDEDEIILTVNERRAQRHGLPPLHHAGQYHDHSEVLGDDDTRLRVLRESGA